MSDRPISARDLVRVTAHLRVLLASPALQLAVPSKGQTVQVRVGGETVGTVDRDEDGDFIASIPILRDELPVPAKGLTQEA